MKKIILIFTCMLCAQIALAANDDGATDLITCWGGLDLDYKVTIENDVTSARPYIITLSEQRVTRVGSMSLGEKRAYTSLTQTNDEMSYSNPIVEFVIYPDLKPEVDLCKVVGEADKVFRGQLVKGIDKFLRGTEFVCSFDPLSAKLVDDKSCFLINGYGIKVFID